MFDEFYRAYPRKVGRLDAEKAWRQMTAKYDANAIIDGAKKFAAWCISEGKEARYIPHPATWLRAGRWMDGELHETIKPEPVVRPAQTVAEVLAFYKAAGKPITPEIECAKSVEDLPVFARMVPANVFPMKAVKP
jgi:hypothetical protein